MEIMLQCNIKEVTLYKASMTYILKLVVIVFLYVCLYQLLHVSLELQILHKNVSKCHAYVHELCHCGLYFLFGSHIWHVLSKPC